MGRGQIDHRVGLALVRGLLEVLDGARQRFLCFYTPTFLEEFSLMILGGREAGVRRLRYPVGSHSIAWNAVVH